MYSITTNEIYFICKGKHCLRISKDDKKISSVISGNPEESLGAKSKFEGIQQVMMTCRYHSGERNKIFAHPTHPVGQKTLFSVRLKNRK